LKLAAKLAHSVAAIASLLVFPNANLDKSSCAG